MVPRFRNPRFIVSLGLTAFALSIPPPAGRAESLSCAFSDFDSDGDVDQADFGHLQACLSGSGIIQTDPDCMDAKLDGDTDVDQDDFGVFQTCMAGPGVPYPAGGLSKIVITEFLASNDSILADEDGDYSDWIELYNDDAIDVDLGGMYLTDDAADLTKWQLPSLNLTPGEYLLVFASGKDRAAAGSELHTNFQINADGEYLGLVYSNGQTTAYEYAPEYPEQRTDISYGLYGNEKHHFAEPTPEAPNNDAFAYFVYDTQFSVDRGFYDTSFQVEITTDTPEATIRYTLDGTEPTETTGTVYTGPITVNKTTCLRAAAYKTDWVPTNVDTQTYIFLADVLNQPANPPGFPATWGGGTTGCPPEGDPNDEIAGDYEIDPDVVQDPTYTDRLNDALTSIPALSIVMNLDDLFDPETGIYSNSECSGIDWERPASAELIFADGTEGFHENAGIRIQGGSSTDNWKSLKLSMRLLFKEEYGPTKLRYKLFPYSDIESINTLVLDARLNMSWIHPVEEYQRTQAQYLRDQYMADLHNALGHVSPHGIRAHVYINGLYWGMYCVHERPDDACMAEYYGGNPEDYDVLRHNRNDVVAGTKARYEQLLNASDLDLSDDANYQAVLDMLDVDNFLDHLIINFWGGNIDWDGGNWYASLNRVDPDGRWRYHSWDAEKVLINLGDNRLSKNSADGPTHIHHRLKQNPEYAVLFSDRAHKLMFNGGVLTPQQAADLYNRGVQEIDTAIIMESARWGDTRRPDFPYKRDNEWLTELNRLLNDYFPQRTDVFLDQLRAAGLYPSVEAPVFNQHGGAVPSGFNLTMTNPNGSGTMYYTLDGSDPRVPGTGQGIDTVLVTEDAAKKVLVPDTDLGDAWQGGNEPYDDSGWTDGTPPIPETPGGVGYDATEDRYDPYITYDVQGEMRGVRSSCYIRIPFTVDPGELAAFNELKLRVRYDDGFVAYINGVAVAAANEPSPLEWDSHATAMHNDSQAVNFQDFYITGFISALQAGDNILALHGLNVLPRTNGDFLISVELVAHAHDPGGVSPTAIEYTGPIELTENTQVKARVVDDTTWSALNEAAFVAGLLVVINEFMADNETTIEDPDEPGEYPDWIELYNADTVLIDLGGMYLTDDLTDPMKWQIPPGITLDSGKYLLFWADDDDEQGDTHTNFKLDNNGEEIGLFAADGTTKIDSIDFGLQYDDVSYGRYPDGTSNWGFFGTPTPGTENAPHDGP